MARHRTARIEVRIALEALAVVKRAAEIQGRSVSDFVVAAAQEAAHWTIEKTSPHPALWRGSTPIRRATAPSARAGPGDEARQAGPCRADRVALTAPFLIEALEPARGLQW